MTIPLINYLIVGAALFSLGAVGFLTRRNLITIFLCAEMMLQGVMINLVAFARHHGNLHGQAFALFVLTVAACEAGVALALVLALYKTQKSLDVSPWQDLRESGVEAEVDREPLPAAEAELPQPRLPVAGRLPDRRREDTYV